MKTIRKWTPTYSMAFSVNFDSYTNVKTPYFTSSVVATGIRPLNIYESNEKLLHIIETSVPEEGMTFSAAREASFNEEDLTVFGTFRNDD